MATNTTIFLSNISKLKHNQIIRIQTQKHNFKINQIIKIKAKRRKKKKEKRKRQKPSDLSGLRWGRRWVTAQWPISLVLSLYTSFLSFLIAERASECSGIKLKKKEKKKKRRRRESWRKKERMRTRWNVLEWGRKRK